MGLLLALGGNFFNSFGEFVGIISHAQVQRKFTLIANACAIDADVDAERAVLIAKGFELWFIKNLLRVRCVVFIPFTGLWFEIFPALGFPVLFLSSLELPALLCVANELCRIQPLHGGLNFGQWCWLCLLHLLVQRRDWPPFGADHE